MSLQRVKITVGNTFAPHIPKFLDLLTLHRSRLDSRCEDAVSRGHIHGLTDGERYSVVALFADFTTLTSAAPLFTWLVLELPSSLAPTGITVQFLDLATC